jgi:hypothetical protein
MIGFFQTAEAALAQGHHWKLFFFSQCQVPGGKKKVCFKIHVSYGISATVKFPDIHHIHFQSAQYRSGRSLVLRDTGRDVAS